MNRLKQIRKQRKLSQMEVGEYLNITPQAYGHYERGLRTPSVETLVKLSSFYGVPLEYLLGDDAVREERRLRIPLLGSVPAGTPIEAIEDVEEYIDIYPRFVKHGDLFALKVQGDSMDPEIRSGDIAIVEKQDFASSGDIVVIRVNGEDVTVKRIKLNSNGIMLIPANPAYDPIFFDTQSINTLPVTIIGRVIEIRRRL